MSKNNVIFNKRIRLVPFTKNLITSTYISWLNDKELMKYSRHVNYIHTIDSCLEFLRIFENSSDSFFWGVISEEFNHVGNIVAYIDRFNKVADLTIMIGEKKARGTGLALAAWNEAIRFLIEECGMRKITAGTMSNNLAMLNIMIKSKMIPDGIRKKHFLYKNKELDLIIYAKFADQMY